MDKWSLKSFNLTALMVEAYSDPAAAPRSPRPVSTLIIRRVGFIQLFGKQQKNKDFIRLTLTERSDSTRLRPLNHWNLLRHELVKPNDERTVRNFHPGKSKVHLFTCNDTSHPAGACLIIYICHKYKICCFENPLLKCHRSPSSHNQCDDRRV